MNKVSLSSISIHAWMQEHNIKNEKGDPIDFHNHLFQYDIYRDTSQNLVVMKAAQVGLSTLEVIKNLYDAKQQQMDIIYTLPTDTDVNIFVGGKVNRIIGQNPILLEYTKDKDSVEQKRVGDSMIYFRGTWTKKAAIMVTADRVVHDEKDSSKQDVISEYQARLQHSKYKQKHTFSHPSSPGTGVDTDWQESDQKHWFVRCSHCNKRQYLSWSTTNPEEMSIDLERRIFVCKHCKGEIYDDDRRRGEWIAKYKNRSFSGYWVPLLICPWVSASEIIDKFNDPESTEEFFYNKVLGLPYVGKGNKLTKEHLLANLTGYVIVPSEEDRVIIGVDTGLRIDYVMGSQHGLFFQGDCTGYKDLDAHMKRWPKAIVIMDAGGDLIGSREFKERWPGRVFLGYLGADKQNTDESMWNDKERMVSIDRNKYIQILVDEFIKKRIPLQGTEDDWYEYWLDWNNLTRKKIVDPITGVFKGYKWIRSGRDHRALATVFWRVGMGRFSKGFGKILESKASFPVGRSVENETMAFKPKFELPRAESQEDWRNPN